VLGGGETMTVSGAGGRWNNDTVRQWGLIDTWESSPATPRELICPCGFDRSTNCWCVFL